MVRTGTISSLKDSLRAHPDLYLLMRGIAHPRQLSPFFRYERLKSALRQAKLKPLSGKTDAGQVLVSLTTYGARIQTVDLAIRSLMMQTMKPAAILLWLDKSLSEDMLPPYLLDLQQYGLRIYYDCEDILGHKKYWYAMCEYPNQSIITVDDDLVYPKDLVESLVRTGAKFPDSVIARRVHRIRFDANGSALPYSSWDYEYKPKESPRADLLATTGAGVLYKPFMYKHLVYKWDEIKRVAPTADDLWMKGAEIAAGLDVVWTPNMCPMPYEIPTVRVHSTLSDTNCSHDGNDECFVRIMRFFRFSASDFEG